MAKLGSVPNISNFQFKSQAQLKSKSGRQAMGMAPPIYS